MAAPRHRKRKIEVLKDAQAIASDATVAKKKKVLVVGGGTGLTTAFMLEGMPNFEVTLLEASNRLGGHIDSIDCGDHGMAEGGAEFVGSEASYPNFDKLLKILKILLESYQLNVNFTQKIAHKHGSSFVLPPRYHTTKQPGASSSCWPKLFGSSNKNQTETRFDLSSVLDNFSKLLGLQATILNAKATPAPQKLEEVKTLEEFLEHFKRYVPDVIDREIDAFAQDVLYPMVAAAWGIPISQAKNMCAHYALNYIALGSEGWRDVPAGLSSYIHEMEALSKNLNIKLETKVNKVIPLSEGGYHVEVESGGALPKLLLGADGKPEVFDDVVISTPAYATKDMLPDLNKDISRLKEALEKVSYYDTTLVFHLDKKYETPKQTVIHTIVEGDFAANTAQKDWKAKNGATPVMKTWVLEGQEKPKSSKILHERKYRHPYMDKAYFAAQLVMREMQNKYGLHFGGILGGNGDSHEDGITAALRIARAISKKYNCLELNDRLKPFLDAAGKIPERNSQLSSPSSVERHQHVAMP